MNLQTNSKYICIYKKAAGNQPDWISLLVAISQALPEGIQISEINTEP